MAARDLGVGAAVRDVVAGAALLAIGLIAGGASWAEGADGVDVAFDLLGVAWILWGVARLVRPRATSPGRPDRTPGPRS